MQTLLVNLPLFGLLGKAERVTSCRPCWSVYLCLVCWGRLRGLHHADHVGQFTSVWFVGEG